jgi:TM2 domain-containing membrane protein YozV
MTAIELIDREQELLDAAVAELPPHQRQLFYERSTEAFKDPDTYATLAYAFIAGLHHFYLNRWDRGLLDISFNLGGLALIVYGVVRDQMSSVLLGVGIVAAIAISELSYLFRSQQIVKRYNLDRQREILAAIQGAPHTLSGGRHV